MSMFHLRHGGLLLHSLRKRKGAGAMTHRTGALSKSRTWSVVVVMVVVIVVMVGIIAMMMSVVVMLMVVMRQQRVHRDNGYQPRDDDGRAQDL